MPKYSETFQNIRKNSKTFRKNPKHSEKFFSVGQTIPESFQHIQNHSRDFGMCSSSAKGTEEAPRWRSTICESMINASAVHVTAAACGFHYPCSFDAAWWRHFQVWYLRSTTLSQLHMLVNGLSLNVMQLLLPSLCLHVSGLAFLFVRFLMRLVIFVVVLLWEPQSHVTCNTAWLTQVLTKWCSVAHAQMQHVPTSC